MTNVGSEIQNGTFLVIFTYYFLRTFVNTRPFR